MGKISTRHGRLVLLGAIALGLSSCGSTAASPQPSTSTAVAKPVATDGTPLSDITSADVPISPGYQEGTGTTDVIARDAAQIGLNALKVFTSDYAKYQKLSEALNQEELLALLPDVQQKLGPLMNDRTLASLTRKWEKDASDPKDLENSVLMLATDNADNPEDDKWKNDANLECGISDAEWTVTFSDPRVEPIPADGVDSMGTAFKTRAHYFVPCAEGLVLRQDMDWQLDLGADPDGNQWQVYRWNRTPVGHAAFVQ